MRNPFLSLWLSQANAWAGAMRGFWTAEMQRQQTEAMARMTQDAVRFWTGGAKLPDMTFLVDGRRRGGRGGASPRRG